MHSIKKRFLNKMNIEENKYMHDIIEHYGKVVIALAGVLAAVLLTAAVVTIVTDRTKGAVSDISYKEHIYDAIDASKSQ